MRILYNSFAFFTSSGLVCSKPVKASNKIFSANIPLSPVFGSKLKYLLTWFLNRSGLAVLTSFIKPTIVFTNSPCTSRPISKAAFCSLISSKISCDSPLLFLIV